MKKGKTFWLLAITVLFVSCANLAVLAGIHATLPDLSNKSDGVYRGNYTLPNSPIKVITDVTLTDHTITKINIVEHSSSPIGKKAETITEKVIKQQHLDVDVVSGATASSKSILKAIENALQ